MQNQLNFSSGLLQYITLSIKIWPSLQLALKNIHSATQPPNNSPLQPHNYKSLSSQQFTKTIISDMHTYIMQHDVQAEHLEQYLEDILVILNVEEENIKTIRYMARELESLIGEMQKGDYERLVKFRQFYENVREMNVGHFKGSQSEGEQGQQGQGEEDYENEDQNQGEEIENQNDKMEEEAPQLAVQKQELEDDGWVIVSKKNRKK